MGCLIYQVVDITNLYFKYETVTVLKVVVPDNLTCPALSVCFPYDQLISRAHLSQVLPHLDNKEVLKLADLETLSIQQLFEMTPEPIDDLLTGCIFRSPNSFSQNVLTVNCTSVITITKFYKQQYICYKFALTNASTDVFTFEYIQNSLVLITSQEIL